MDSHLAPAFATAFLASSVEAVEAMTVVLAAGVTRGWRSALIGAGAGAALLAAIVAALGPAILRVPIACLQVVTGTLLLLFGMRWLRKAMLRYAGAIPMRDEDELFARERRAFGTRGEGGFDWVAALAVLKVVLLEGIEVVVIVLGIGAAGGALMPASAGAAAACAIVAVVALAVHRPLARVPENALKLAVGITVSAFGIDWFGEGVGIHWPAGDAMIVALVAALAATALGGVSLARQALR